MNLEDEPAAEVATSQVWGVRPIVPALVGVLCAGFLLWLLIAASPEDKLVAGAGVCLSAIAAALLVTMRQRLSAYPDALVVRGPFGANEVQWARVTAISAPTRRRRGLASTSLEIEYDDDSLLVFSRTELGTDPADVAAALRTWWRATG